MGVFVEAGVAGRGGGGAWNVLDGIGDGRRVEREERSAE